MFPGPNDVVYYNDAGEPLGWDKPSEPEYCPDCGGMHSSFNCPQDWFEGDHLEGEEEEDDI